MFATFEKLWEARNQDCHDLTNKENAPQSSRMQRMHNRARTMHTEAEELTTEDRKLFKTDTQTTLQKQPLQFETWTTDTGKESQAAFEERETLDNHPITDYFPILSSSTNNTTPHHANPPMPSIADHG